MIKSRWNSVLRRRNSSACSCSIGISSAGCDNYESCDSFLKGCLKVKSDCQLVEPQRRLTTVQKSVSFHEVNIREYERIVGDHPSCSSGAPVSLGWKYVVTVPALVDDYEAKRACNSPSTSINFLLRKDIRELILLEWGVSKQEIAHAVRSTVKAKNQRRRTVSSIGRYHLIEEMVEETTHKIKRSLQIRKQFNNTSGHTNRRRDEIARLSICSSDSDDSRNANMTLKNIMKEYPDSFPSPICTSVRMKEAISAKTAINSTSNIKQPKVTHQKTFDRAPTIPTRPISPVPIRLSNSIFVATNQTSPLPDLTTDCLLSLSDPGFHLPSICTVSLVSETIHDDFDASITTVETRNDRVLTLSFSQDSILDMSTNISIQEEVTFPGDDDVFTHSDDETTINSKFVRKVIKPATIGRSTTSLDDMEQVRTIPVDDTESTIDIEVRHSSIKMKPTDAASIENYDEETTINSQFIDLFYGSGEDIERFEPSNNTLLETNRDITSYISKQNHLEYLNIDQTSTDRNTDKAKEQDSLKQNPVLITKPNENMDDAMNLPSIPSAGTPGMVQNFIFEDSASANNTAVLERIKNTSRNECKRYISCTTTVSTTVTNTTGSTIQDNPDHDNGNSSSSIEYFC